MDTVHPRRRQHAGHGALETRRQADVAVMERDREEEEAFPDRQGTRAGAGRHHLQRAIRRGDRHVGSVEPQRRAGVEVEIDVVDQVEAPQPGKLVRQDVPKIDAVIHQENGDRVTAPGRQRQPLREADAAPLHRAGQRRDDRGFERLHHRQRACAEDDVADAALGLALGPCPKRPAPLGQQDAGNSGAHQGRGEQRAELGHLA